MTDDTQGNSFDFEDPERFEHVPAYDERPLSEFALWHRNLFNSLKVGGTWGIPRSGLIFTRTGEDTFALTARMPHMDGMPITAEQVLEQQDGDYAGVKRYCEEAGISVSDTTTTGATS